MPYVQYETVAEARAHLKDLLDAAADGVPATLDGMISALACRRRPAEALFGRTGPRAEMVARREGGRRLSPAFQSPRMARRSSRRSPKWCLRFGSMARRGRAPVGRGQPRR